MQHYFHLFGDAEISLYSGSGQAAWRELLDRWPGLKRSLLLRSQYFRIEALQLRARCALSAAESHNLSAANRRRFLRFALKDARRIAREKTPWADPLSALLGAGVSSHRGDEKGAVERLKTAEIGFDATKMALYAAAARRCRGTLLGGEEGRGLVESADAWMRGERIKNPLRMTAMLAPGRWTPA